MPSSDPVQRFSDIIENIDAIERFTAGMDLRGFAMADQTIRAVKYSLLVSGSSVGPFSASRSCVGHVAVAGLNDHPAVSCLGVPPCGVADHHTG